MLLSNFVMVAGVGLTDQSVYSRKQVGGSKQTMYNVFSFAFASIVEILMQMFYNSN